MPAGFGSLPFDVLLTICQQVDALSNRGAYKSTTSSTGKLVGRHVVANADTVPDSLLALSAVNRCTRDVSEPLIFGTVTFGSKWEGHGELRWAIAKVRMRGMIQKQSLRHTVKSLVWHCSSKAPWDSVNQSRPQFWALFAELMQHLKHVETVELGFWSELLDPYPVVWQKLLAHKSAHHTREERVSHSARSSSREVGNARWAKTIFGGVSCFPSPPLTENEDEIPGGPLIGVIHRFPNIKTARLRRSSQWFAAHCPNLEHFIDAGYVKKCEELHLTTLGRHCGRIQTLATMLVASPELISEILSYFSLLEELAMVAPDECQTAGRRALEIVPLIGKASNLRSLKFLMPTFKGLFPQRGEQLRNLLDATVAKFAEQCPSLLVLKLGEFMYARAGSDEPFSMIQLPFRAKTI